MKTDMADTKKRISLTTSEYDGASLVGQVGSHAIPKLNSIMIFTFPWMFH